MRRNYSTNVRNSFRPYVEPKKENSVKPVNFADRRKTISVLYDDDAGLRAALDTSVGASGRGRYNEQTLNRVLDQIGSGALNFQDVLALSNYAYASDPTYQRIVDYFASMYLWRYLYVPVLVKENSSDYAEIYKLMGDVIDGVGLEVTMPKLLTELVINGVIYLLTDKQTSSKTVSTMVLNPQYCRKIKSSQFGTGLYQFNATYFEDLGVNTSELEESVFPYFPDVLVKAYREYQNTGEEWQLIDGRYAAYVSLNESSFPTLLGTLPSIFDSDKYRKNEVLRNANELDRLVTHKIPMYENQLPFEMEEIKSLHRTMSRQLAVNSRTKLLTTFGELQIHPLQESGKVQSEVLRKAQEAIYFKAGLNVELFLGQTAEAVQAAMRRDEAFIWKYVQEIMNFYNVTINNLFNFKGYQVEVNMLPITHYNQKEFMETYRRNAEYGVGRLELVIASGTKQRHISAKHDLETFLNLGDVLQPLESAHTRSAKEVDKDEKEDEKEDGGEVNEDES